MTTPRVIVIGAGIGGLTAAALLQQRGYQVTVLEAQNYPGGCASTFTHKGFRFDSGATVIGGFQEHGPHHIVGQRLNLDWPVRLHEPAWVTHLPDRSIALTSDNANVLACFPGTQGFWRQQASLASLGWEMSAHGLPWPPSDPHEAVQLVKVGLQQFPQIVRALPFAFMNVHQWLRLHGLHKNRELIRFLDAQLLISAQTTSKKANALYAATALDLARQGVFHVEGGIGSIAETLIKRLENLGGEIRYRHVVEQIVVENQVAKSIRYKIGRRTKTIEEMATDIVVANLTPWNLQRLLGDQAPTALIRENRKRRNGWGAFVLHIGLDANGIPKDFPDHHQIITEPHGSLGETRSIFLSISPTWDPGRAPLGQRAMTVTTHTEVTQWWQLLDRDPDAYEAKKARYTKSMIDSIDKILPGFRDNITLTLAGTPLTYQYYTMRHLGMVGGFPQTSLLKARGPRTGIANLRLVGDSIFPGQSTAAVSLGAMRVVDDLVREDR